MKRILLIRHGQTDWNVEGRWQGHMDQPLNATGLEQAQALGEYLREKSINAVYSSDLLRARVTAEQIAEMHGLTVKTDARWREQNLGVFQGLTTSEISSKYPEEMRKLRENYLDFAPPEAETRRVMQDRAFAAYSEIITNESGQDIAVVSHGGTIRVLLYKFFGDEILRRSVHNTSISIIETDGTTQKLIETAVTPHLIE
jgi:broad specificity phosphatase PhoE